MHTIDISIVTLNYREAEVTKKSIEKLLRSKRVSFEIILIDNSCLEKDAKVLATISDKRVRFFPMSKNLGCSEGYNFGISEAKGKYVFIVNNDTEIPDRYALFKMKIFLDKHPAVAVLQPKIKSFSNQKMFEYAGAAGGFIDFLGYPFCRGRIFSTIEKDTGQYDQVVNVVWASTCAFFARKKCLQEAGMFDPIYFAYAEEVDISLRMWSLGYRVVFLPSVEVLHKGETSWKKIRGRKTYLIHRNHLILYLKCLPARDIILFLPQRLLLELVSMIYYIFNNSSLHVTPVLHAHLSIIFMLPYIFYRRWIFFKGAKKNRAPIYRKSIVYEHFFYKKEKFMDLNRKEFALL